MQSRSRRESEVVAILEALGKEDDERTQELTDFVEREALRLERNIFLEFLRDVNAHIQKHLTKQKHVTIEIGHLTLFCVISGSLLIAVRAVDQLIRVEFLKEEPGKLMELVKVLTVALGQMAMLESGVRERVLQSAARSFGQLVKSGGAVTAARTGRHIEDMLELLNEADALSSTVALRLLAVLAENAPAQFNLCAEKFQSKMYPFLFHDEGSVRRDALDALKGCLGVVAQKASGKRQGWFQDLARKLMDVVSDGSTTEMLKALVALRVVIQHSTGNLLSLFPSFCEMATKLMSHQEAAAGEEVVRLMPILAQMCPQNFANTFFSTCMDHLIMQLGNKTHEVEILEAVEQVMQTMVNVEGSGITERLGKIAEILQTVLSDQQAVPNIRQAAVKCTGTLTTALHDDWKPHALKLLPLVLASPVDQTLLSTACSMVGAYHEARPSVQSAFLALVSEAGVGSADCGSLLRVLQILSTFHFELTPSLVEKLTSLLGPSLSLTNNIGLRTAAAKACMNILVQNTLHRSGHDLLDFLDELCSLLVSSSVMDVSSDIRFDLLSDMLLHEELHQRLAQDATIRRLAYGLYDTSIEIRQLCIQLMGALSHYNFAAALPLLHELLLKFMEDLKFTGDFATMGAIITNSTVLLRALILAQSRVVEPHLASLMGALLFRLEYYTSPAHTCLSVKDPTSDAICGLLLCWMEVVRRASHQTTRHNISRIAVTLSELIKGSSDRKKRIMAMKAIEKHCEIPGDALLQHMQPSELLSCLIDLKNNSGPPGEACSMDNIIPILCKWNPMFQVLTETPDEAPEMSAMRPAGDMLSFPTDESMVGDEEFYSSVAINASLAVLEDTRNTNYDEIVKCLMSIFGRLQRSGVVYLQRVVPALTKIVRQADDKLRLVLFQHLSDLVRIAGEDVTPYCDALMHLCLQFWTGSSALSVHILNLIAELARAVKESFSSFIPEIIPRLGDIISKPADFQLVEPVLSLLQACDAQLGPFLPVLFPPLIQFLQKVPIYEEAIPLNIQREVLKTLRHVLLSVQFRETEKYLMASKLFLTLIELLHQEESLKVDTMDTLVIVVSVLGPKISRAFAQQVQNALGNTEEGLLQEGLQRLSDTEFTDPDVFTAEELRNLRSTTFRPITRTVSHSELFKLDIVKLAHAWDIKDRSTREDWEEWIRALSVEFLRQSSSPALRACHSLAQINQSVAKWLFKYSLLSVWSKLDSIYRLQLQEALGTVLLTPAMPLEVVQPIISLGEYLNFIEQQEVPVASELSSLNSLAEKVNSYATVPHYRMRH